MAWEPLKTEVEKKVYIYTNMQNHLLNSLITTYTLAFVLNCQASFQEK